MKFSIHRLAFLKSISDVQRVISSRTTIPILTGIKIDVTPSQIVLTGSDSEISLELVLPVSDEGLQLKIEKTGSIVLHARFFSDIVKKLPADLFTLEVIDDKKAVITAGNSSFTLNGISASEYPHLPEIHSTQLITLPVPLFKQVIQQTIIATSNQESRPILTGIHMVIKNGMLKAVATDSHRLSQRIIPLSSVDPSLEYEMTIPGKTLSELSKITDGLEEIQLAITENQVLFQTENLSFYSRLLDGRYPDVDRLFTNEVETTIVMNANELLQAVDRASLMTQSGTNHIVKLNISAHEVVLTGHTPEIGTVVETLLPDVTQGRDLVISFNSLYLKEALRAFGNTDVSIRFIESVRPFTLVPASPSSDIPNSFIQLITPIRTFD